MSHWIFEEKFNALTVDQLFDRGDPWQASRVYRRSEIVDTLMDLYRRAGGVDQDLTKDRVSRIVKKKLSGRNAKNRWFKNVAFGRYEYCGSNAHETLDSLSRGLEEGTDGGDGSSQRRLVPEKEYGDGDCEVYVWCLPQYAASGDQWPVKIGFAGEGGLNRRWRDFHENLPEVPQYLIRVGFKTEAEARKFEGMLHYYFKNRGRQIEGIPGKEWFNVNPEEVVGAIGVLHPNLRSASGSE